jgi:hypothetical protein
VPDSVRLGWDMSRPITHSQLSGIDAAAPANTRAVKSQPAKPNEPPVLLKRKSQEKP